MKTCLFVGGPADGAWHSVDTSMPVWRVYVPREKPLEFDPSDTPMIAHDSYAIYKLVDFHFGNREIFIYQHVGMDLDPLGLLHHICKRYGK